jgi:hypothetical protein
MEAEHYESKRDKTAKKIMTKVIQAGSDERGGCKRAQGK